MSKTVSLVLGSGGARGLAHIGVIRWLEHNGYEIRSISGCSMGALIGGIYACGKLEEYSHWVSTLDKMDIVTLLDFSWRKSGLVKGDKIINALIELVGNHQIESLPIRFTAVAADIFSEKEVWIQQGRLFDAIRASISLPLFFTPHRLNGVDLIDGGVLNPVPIAPTFGDTNDLTIAVNLCGKPQGKPLANQDIKAHDNKNMHDKVRHWISKFTEGTTPTHQDLSPYEIANQAFDAMQSTIARQKLAAYPPDITLTLPRDACGILDFHKADAMIARGVELAEESLSPA